MSLPVKIIYEAVKILITAFIITNIVNIILFGPLKPHFSRAAKDTEFFVRPAAESVKSDNGTYFEFQQGGGCAGFSSAFLLRHMGEAANGDDTFKEVPYQLKGGAGLPKGITGFFKKKGIKMTACSGNFNALKNEIAYQPNIPMAGVSEPPRMGSTVHEVWLKKIDDVRLAPPPPPPTTPVKIPGVGIVRGNVLVSARGKVLNPEGVTLPEPPHVSLPVNGTPTPTLHSLEQGIKVETNDVPPVEEGQ